MRKTAGEKATQGILDESSVAFITALKKLGMDIGAYNKLKAAIAALSEVQTVGIAMYAGRAHIEISMKAKDEDTIKAIDAAIGQIGHIEYNILGPGLYIASVPFRAKPRYFRSIADGFRGLRDYIRSKQAPAMEDAAAYKSFKVSTPYGSTLEIIISEREVTAAQFRKMAPPMGYGALTVTDGELMWRGSADFREDLHKNGGIWTGEMDLRTYGPRKIAENGSQWEVSVGDFAGLPTEQKSWHHTGRGQVELIGSGYLEGIGWVKGLFAIGGIWYKLQNRAAYAREIADGAPALRK